MIVAAPPMWSGSPCVSSSPSRRPTPRAQIAGATTRAPMSNDDWPPRPPVSTSSVVASGKRTSVASPWPTSMPVTWRRRPRSTASATSTGARRSTRPSRRPRTSRHPARAIASGPAASATTPRRAQTSPAIAYAPRRPRTAPGRATPARAPVQEVRAAHEHPRGADDDPAGEIRHRRPPGVTRDDRHPRLLDDGHRRHRGEVDDRPRDRDAAEQQRRRRQEHRLGRQRRRHDHERRDARPRGHASHAQGAVGQRRQSRPVAPTVSTKPASTAASGDGDQQQAGSRREHTERRCPQVARLQAEIDGRHRGSRARPTSRRRRVRRRATTRGNRAGVRHGSRHAASQAEPAAASTRRSRCCRPRSR